MVLPALQWYFLNLYLINNVEDIVVFINSNTSLDFPEAYNPLW